MTIIPTEPFYAEKLSILEFTELVLFDYYPKAV